MIHSLLVWWASELGSEATSEEHALSVMMLALDLLKDPSSHQMIAGDAVDLGEKSAAPV
jgi:hypothetical protein